MTLPIHTVRSESFRSAEPKPRNVQGIDVRAENRVAADLVAARVTPVTPEHRPAIYDGMPRGDFAGMSPTPPAPLPREGETVTLDQINSPGCPHTCICEECGYPSGEHIRRPLGERGYRCPTAREIANDRADERGVQAWKSRR